MTDTAQSEEVVQITSPVLDLDVMLADLHNEFSEETDDTGGDDASGGTSGDTGDTTTGVAADPSGDGQHDDGTDSTDLSGLLPPGYVRFGEEILPEQDVKALLELNRRVKNEPDTASRVRDAILGQKQTQEQAPDLDALPVWLDPDDEKSVFLYRQQQRIDREVQEIRSAEAQRIAQQTEVQRQVRETEVRDAFRASMKEFRDDYPVFDLEDLNKIANRAANMGLLEHPEKVGGTLKGGIVTALETAMWSEPQFREKAAAGATVRTQEQQSASRKQKSSALSSSTGSVVRTQSQEQTPTTRQEIMSAGLDFLRSGAVTD